MNFFAQILSAVSFSPRGDSYLWDPVLVRLHLISDFLIAAAYFSIPITLIYFVRKRRDLPFNWIFVCFGIFIFACGVTHVLEIVTVWKPLYWISGTIKAITAFASVPTAILLIRLVPAALDFPGPSVLHAANEALIEQTKLLNLIVTNMGDGLLVVDKDGHSLLSNPATRRMLKLGPDEEVPRNCADDCGFYRPDKKTKLRAGDVPTTRAVVGESIDREEIFIRHSGGGGIWADVTARPLRDEQREIHGAVAVFRDITAHKESEEQQEMLLEERTARVEAEAANRAKDKFVAMLGHELRTPLTPVLAGVELLAQQVNGHGELRSTIELIRRNVELEARLIDDILDLTAIAKGKVTLDLNVIDVHAVVRSALEIFQREVTKKNLRIVSELKAGQSFAKADHARLMQVFWNVINNAIKFTSSEGLIRIQSHNEPEGNIVVDVSDTGIGIEPEFLPRIFDSFEQGVRKVQSGHGGLGLGLAISKAIVEAHDGQMLASSPGRNRGTIVTVSLATVPVSTARKAVAPMEDSSPHRSSSPAKLLRILLVDDHTDTVTALGMLLRRIGYEVECAESKTEALQLAARSHFDLLVTDIGLPDGTGHELLLEIRARQPIAAIAVSGFGMEDDLEKSRAAGFAKHLIKPLNVDQLQSALREIAAPPMSR